MNGQEEYQQTIDYLYTRLPMFSRLGAAALKPNLDNTLKLCAALGNPQEQFKSIHIAGTNGKGSTSHMLAAILQQAGYKTGLYTSPHLVDFRERIRINGAMIEKEWVTKFVSQHEELIEDVDPSFFEVTVAMAFAYFAEQEVDYAVIETGLGGRLDSTNVITPLLSIITNISYDHTYLLGDTLPKIASEKAGIIKQGIPALIGEQQEETGSVFFEKAVHSGSSLYYAESLWDVVRVKQDGRYQYCKAVHKAKREIFDFRTDLLGAYQKHNLVTALAAAEVLTAAIGIELPLEGVLLALGKVKELTGLKGRWEWLQQKPIIIADVGHNPAGIAEVMKQWADVQADAKHIVVGFVKDKDVAKALSLFPTGSVYYFCNAQLPRALPAEELKEIAEDKGLNGAAYATVSEAVAAAKANMGQNDALLITGSFFIVGEALEGHFPLP